MVSKRALGVSAPLELKSQRAAKEVEVFNVERNTDVANKQVFGQDLPKAFLIILNGFEI